MANPIFAIIAVVAAVGKAAATYNAGRAQQAAYEARADRVRLSAKADKIKAKEEGVKVLEETNSVLSTLIAKTYANGSVPDSGSNLVAQYTSIRSGVEDFNLAALNEEIIQNLGIIEVKNLKAAGKAAKRQGTLAAITGFGMDLASGYQAGGGKDIMGTGTAEIPQAPGGFGSG
jgi:hypothetical protein